MKNTEDKSRANWRSIYFLSAVSFFNDIASEMIYPLIPVFIKTVLGFGAEIIGVIEGVAESINSLLKLFSGWISDKAKKRKIFVLAGYSLSNLVRPLIGISGYWGAVLGFRLTDRIGKGIRTSPRDAMICDLAPEDRRGLAFGIQRGMDHAGAVIGPLISSLLITFFLLDLKKVFLLSYIPGIIAVLIVIFGVREIKKDEHVRLEELNKFQSGQCLSGRGAGDKSISPAESDKGVDDEGIDGKASKKPILFFKDFKKLGGRFNYLLSVLVIFTLGNSTDAFLLLRASDLGVQLAYIPLLWSVLHLSKTLFSLLGGHLSDKTGRKTIIGLGWSVYLLTYIGFAFADNLWQIWALFAFYGLFFGFTEGVEKALVGDMVSKDTRGLAYGFYNFAIGIAALPASIVFGLVWKLSGFRYAFIMGAGISLAALIMLAFLRIPGRKQS